MLLRPTYQLVQYPSISPAQNLVQWLDEDTLIPSSWPLKRERHAPLQMHRTLPHEGAQFRISHVCDVMLHVRVQCFQTEKLPNRNLKGAWKLAQV